jgi:pathogenesis-related protein 1
MRPILESRMPSTFMMRACLISLLVMGLGASQAEAQTARLESVKLTALKNAEKDRFLAAHNAARKAVGVDPLAWSDELSQVALDTLDKQKDQLIEKAKEGWAEGQIVLPDHRKDDKFGENIAGWAGNKVPGAERAMTWWLSEKAAFDKLNVNGSYKFGDEKGKTEIDAEGNERPVVVGHYTAIVWKDTAHLGAAKLTFQLADDRGTVRTYVAIVCNYDPAGNIDGDKPF